MQMCTLRVQALICIIHVRWREGGRGRRTREREREKFIGPAVHAVAIRCSLTHHRRCLPLLRSVALQTSRYRPAQHPQGQGTPQSRCRQGDRVGVPWCARGRLGLSVHECGSWGRYD